MPARWKPSPPPFVDAASPRDPVLQILDGLEKHIAAIPADEPPAPRTPMLGARLCYRNALHLYGAGVTLAGSGEFGPARSLMILALEEFGKAWVYSMLEVEVFTRDPAQRRTKSYLDDRIFRCHRCKQGLVYAVEFGWSAMALLGTFPTEADLGGEAATAEEAAKLAAQHIKAQASKPPPLSVLEAKLRARPEEIARLSQLFADRKAMEDTKWQGIYVDYELQPPTVPQKVAGPSYEQVRAFVARWLTDFAGYFLTEFPAENWARIKAIFSGMRLPRIELTCPRNKPLDHPTTPKQIAAMTAAAKAGSRPKLGFSRAR